MNTPAQTPKQKLVVISGASGVGKDSVVALVREHFPHVYKTVSVTTRAPRSTDVHGRDYYFVSEDTFSEYIEKGLFVEWEIYGAHRYGTLISEIEDRPQDTLIFLVIDVRGRHSVMSRYPTATSVFIEPPSLEELENRLVSRGQNTPEEIKQRLAVAKEEIKHKVYYDFVAVNGDKEQCANEIAAHIRSVFGS